MILVKRHAVSVEHELRHKEHNPRQILGQLLQNVTRDDEAGHVHVAAKIAVLDGCDGAAETMRRLHKACHGVSRAGAREAQQVLAAGGDVTGVEPEFFVKGELQHDGLTELIVTKDMTERKTKMIELGDAFIAFPGGTGTLEEIAEVMSKVSLKHLDAPCILYDLDGYYTGLRMLLSHMIETGLSSEERQEGIYFAKDLAEIKTILNL